MNQNFPNRLSAVPIAVCASPLSCGKAGKARIFTPDRESSGDFRLRSSGESGECRFTAITTSSSAVPLARREDVAAVPLRTSSSRSRTQHVTAGVGGGQTGLGRHGLAPNSVRNRESERGLMGRPQSRSDHLAVASGALHRRLFDASHHLRGRCRPDVSICPLLERRAGRRNGVLAPSRPCPFFHRDGTGRLRYVPRDDPRSTIVRAAGAVPSLPHVQAVGQADRVLVRSYVHPLERVVFVHQGHAFGEFSPAFLLS